MQNSISISPTTTIAAPNPLATLIDVFREKDSAVSGVQNGNIMKVRPRNTIIRSRAAKSASTTNMIATGSTIEMAKHTKNRFLCL